MPDISSFTIGPVINEELRLVNVTFFQKSIMIATLSGVVDLKRKNFWKRSKKPRNSFDVTDEDEGEIT